MEGKPQYDGHWRHWKVMLLPFVRRHTTYMRLYQWLMTGLLSSGTLYLMTTKKRWRLLAMQSIDDGRSGTNIIGIARPDQKDCTALEHYRNHCTATLASTNGIVCVCANRELFKHWKRKREWVNPNQRTEMDVVRGSSNAANKRE